MSSSSWILTPSVAASASSASICSSVLLLGGEVVLQRGADPLELVDHGLLAALDLLADDALRRRHLGGRDQLPPAPCPGRRRAARPACTRLTPLAQVGAQLVEGVELAGQLGELVVQLGQLLLLDRADGHRHLGVAAGEVAADQLRW